MNCIISVFKYLQDMTHSWECRRDIINKLAGKVKRKYVHTLYSDIQGI